MIRSKSRYLSNYTTRSLNYWNGERCLQCLKLTCKINSHICPQGDPIKDVYCGIVNKH